MSRQIKSPVQRWEGTITLYEPLTIEQVIAIEDAMDLAVERKDSKFLAALNKAQDNKANLMWTSRTDALYIPVIMQCVEKWELSNWEAGKFPATPRKDAHYLVTFIWAELLDIYKGETTIPNA